MTFQVEDSCGLCGQSTSISVAGIAVLPRVCVVFVMVVSLFREEETKASSWRPL